MTTIDELRAEESKIVAKIAAHTEAEKIMGLITETNTRIADGNEGRLSSQHFLKTIHEHIQVLFREVAPMPPPSSSPLQQLAQPRLPVELSGLPVMPVASNGLAISPPATTTTTTATPTPIRPATTSQPPGPGVIEALRIINEIEELAIDVPDKSQPYAEGAVLKAKRMGASIEKVGGLTVKETDELTRLRNEMKKLVRRGGGGG